MPRELRPQTWKISVRQQIGGCRQNVRCALERLRVTEESVREMAEKVRGVAGLADPLGRQLATTELMTDWCFQGDLPAWSGGGYHRTRVATLQLEIASHDSGVSSGSATSAATVSPSSLVRKGRQELVAGRLDAAEQAFRAALITAPHDASAHRGMAEVYRRKNKRAEAIQELQTALELRDSAVDRTTLARIYHEKKKPDLAKAERIVMDAKVDYPAACNSVETLLVDAAVAGEFLPKIVAALHAAGVEVRGCEQTRVSAKSAKVKAASETDWATEYGDLILSAKVVAGLEDAVAHIHKFGSSHTEAIVTEDTAAAERFMSEVDAASVFHNVSTRFADGYRYGLGAEVGISNGKLHARGPMGLEGLTTYKYKLRGSEQTAQEYRSGKVQAPGDLECGYGREQEKVDKRLGCFDFGRGQLAEVRAGERRPWSQIRIRGRQGFRYILCRPGSGEGRMSQKKKKKVWIPVCCNRVMRFNRFLKQDGEAYDSMVCTTCNKSIILEQEERTCHRRYGENSNVDGCGKPKLPG
jgi:glutamate-5-semialdehyde dehydrogenase